MFTYPQPYIEYLIEFHATRDYFECHEILEEYWKETAGSPLGSVWVGLIQLAVALYHERRGNRPGAQKMLSSAIGRLSDERVKEIGVDGTALLPVLKIREEQLRQPELAVYADINIPLSDPELLNVCLEECRRRGLTWQAVSDLENRGLIGKHTLRDRSDVIREREKQLQLRRTKREG